MNAIANARRAGLLFMYIVCLQIGARDDMKNWIVYKHQDDYFKKACRRFHFHFLIVRTYALSSL